MNIKQELLDSISERTRELDLLLKEASNKSDYAGYARLVKEWRKLVALYNRIEMEREDEKTQ